MKVGTRFKIEFEVTGPNACRAIGATAEVALPHSSQHYGSGTVLYGANPVDVVVPRRRFTDVDGTEYEVLVDGDKWEDGDVMHNRPSGVREKATVLVGSKVHIGPNYKIGLRKVKA